MPVSPIIAKQEARPSASELLDEALGHHQAGRLGEAERIYRRILATDPRHAPSLHLLGMVAYQSGKAEPAIDLISRAISVNPNVATFHSNLGNILQLRGQPERAVECYDRSLAINPGSLTARSNLGFALRLLGRLDEAIAQFDLVIAQDPLHAVAQLHRALIEMLRGNFASALPDYEWRWRLPSPGAKLKLEPARWDGRPLRGERILLYAEQGLGDTLQYLRFVAQVQARGGEVVLEVPESLRAVVRQIPGVVHVVVAGEPLPPLDWQCPLMSLPLALGTTLETIPAEVPYISVPPEAWKKAKAVDWPSERLRVGIVWAGSPTHLLDCYRSIPLDLLSPLFGQDGAAFFSLQKGPATSQLGTGRFPITDLGAGVDDMADTAALIEQLDLLIAVDTSVAHLAGALGKPVWLLLPFAPDWRWLLDRKDSPWYPTMRLFRQPMLNDWESPILAVRDALVSWLETGRYPFLEQSLNIREEHHEA